MTSQWTSLALILFLTLTQVFCTVYYADSSLRVPESSGTSIESPFTTIQECVDALERPGDECRIREGRYHESVEISGKHGNEATPFVIAGYKNEMPVLDGTVSINVTWSEYKNGIYKVSSSIFADIRQNK